MRIITYNIYGMQGYPAEVAATVLGPRGSETHLAHYARTLDGLAADIIVLQEGVQQTVARDLARLLQRHLATFVSPTAFPGHILSRFPILESRTFSHVHAEEDVPPFSRNAGAALLEVAQDQHLWIVDVHLHPGDIDMRQREADQLRGRLEGLLGECANAIVLGDFNCPVEEGGIHTHLVELGFTNAMQAVGGGLQLTMNTAGIRDWIIDHIYVSPDMTPTLREATVIRDPGFRTDPPRPDGCWDHSDHLPVRADLDWP
jgi:endonuclease/exonuclease/phosphatase family metal-dependent hydrolase